MADTKLLSRENSLVTIEINASEKETAEFSERVIKRLQKTVSVPGFRKGKAPVPMLKRYLGMNAIYEEILNTIISETYYQALDDLELKPISDPEFEDLDNINLETGTSVTFKAKVTVVPEVKLFDYEDFKMEREQQAVTDEDIDKQLEMIRKDYIQYVPTDRKEVQNGDLVVMDFRGYVDGEQFPRGTANDSQLIIGSGKFIPGFEEQIVGMTIDVEKEIEVTFPLDYPTVDLAGKDAKFVVLVKDIKAEEIPELDDEFAKDLTDVQSLQELKERIRHNMTHYIQDATIKALGAKVLQHIVENSEIEVPELFIKDEIDDNLERLKMRLAAQGLTLKKYFEVTKKTEEEVKDNMEKDARETIMTKLVVNEIAKNNDGLYPMVYQIDNEISATVEENDHLFQEDKDKMMKDKKLRSDIAERIMMENVLDFLGRKCNANPIPECEACKEMHAQHHHDDEECKCDHDDKECKCDHDDKECECDHDDKECECDHDDKECEYNCDQDDCV